VIELEGNKARDIKKITEEFAEKIAQGKSEVKERYNVKAQKVNIDTKKLIGVLIKNRI